MRGDKMKLTKQAKASRRKKQVKKEAGMHQQALRRKDTGPKILSKESVPSSRKSIKEE